MAGGCVEKDEFEGCSGCHMRDSGTANEGRDTNEEAVPVQGVFFALSAL